MPFPFLSLLNCPGVEVEVCRFRPVSFWSLAIIPKGKHHKVALSHVMRILTRRLVAVLMTGKPYEVCAAKLN